MRGLRWLVPTAALLASACAAAPYRILLHDAVGEPTALCEVSADSGEEALAACGCGAVSEHDRCVAMRAPSSSARIVQLGGPGGPERPL